MALGSLVRQAFKKQSRMNSIVVKPWDLDSSVMKWCDICQKGCLIKALIILWDHCLGMAASICYEQKWLVFNCQGDLDLVRCETNTYSIWDVQLDLRNEYFVLGAFRLVVLGSGDVLHELMWQCKLVKEFVWIQVMNSWQKPLCFLNGSELSRNRQHRGFDRKFSRCCDIIAPILISDSFISSMMTDILPLERFEFGTFDFLHGKDIQPL